MTHPGGTSQAGPGPLAIHAQHRHAARRFVRQPHVRGFFRGRGARPQNQVGAKTRPPSARSVRDAALVNDIKVAHKANFGVYGARKVHAELNRVGVRVARCTVERLMRADGLRGIPREKTRKTTICVSSRSLAPPVGLNVGPT